MRLFFNYNNNNNNNNIIVPLKEAHEFIYNITYIDSVCKSMIVCIKHVSKKDLGGKENHAYLPPTSFYNCNFFFFTSNNNIS